jgi:periplasmic divalent cation tolerance protein
VNIVPGVRSVYQWDGRLQEEEEVLCLIKTRHAVFERARDRILALHPYDVPEIHAEALEHVHAPYAAWVAASVGAAAP